jgi:hypothetical protein
LAKSSWARAEASASMPFLKRITPVLRRLL